MQVQAVGTQNARAPQRVDRGLGALRSEDFFRILVTELQQQDPFEPTKTSDMINQVAQVRAIEMSGRLNETLDALAHQQRTGEFSNLIGKYVTARVVGPDGTVQTVEGVVTGVRFDQDGVPLLELDTGDIVRARDVERITTLEVAELTGEETDEAADADKQAAASRRLTRPREPWFQLDTKIRL